MWLRNPDLVVLDEATARVDPETEQRIAEAIAELMKGRTTFVIAHRLSTLDMVDEVIVFDHGRIAEHGDRADLVDNRDSHFRHLLELALAVEADVTAGRGRSRRRLRRCGRGPDAPPSGGGRA